LEQIKLEKIREIENLSSKLEDLHHNTKIKELNLENIKKDVERKVKELTDCSQEISI
jgi:hypothetical protein